jgi:Flp pilus assembly protein TadD
MKTGVFLLVAFLLGGCATSTRQTDRLLKSSTDLPAKSRLTELKLIKQKQNHCGPATLAMVLKHVGKNVSLTEITLQSFTEKAQGTFQADMLSTARHQGMLTIPINTMEDLIKETAAGHAVIVFQNLGFSWWPQWHYAVVSGHDLSGPDIYLHTGDKKFAKTDMRFFERSWKLGGYWGLLILPPNQLSAAGSELAHAQAGALLEQLSKLREAQISYQTMLTKWPQSLSALIGLGNIAYAEAQYPQAINALNKAVLYHPRSAAAWHNLAFAQWAAGKKTLAKTSAQKALDFVESESKATYQNSLAEFLKYNTGSF